MTDLVAVLASICELDIPTVSLGPDIDRPDPEIKALVGLGALVATGRLDSVTCLACDEPHDAPVIDHVGEGRYRYYCHSTGYHEVGAQALKLFTVSLPWLICGISEALGRSIHAGRVESPIPRVQRVGTFRFGQYLTALFIGRRLDVQRGRVEALGEAARQAAKRPVLVITSTPLELVPPAGLSRVAMVPLTEVLSFDSRRIAVDQAPILHALRGTLVSASSTGVGFSHSPGFRTVTWGEDKFEFTDKQALAVEALHQAWVSGTGRLHQEELKGAADTSQRMVQLFQGNPAYGALIRNDGQGIYWLDL